MYRRDTCRFFFFAIPLHFWKRRWTVREGNLECGSCRASRVATCVSVSSSNGYSSFCSLPSFAQLFVTFVAPFALLPPGSGRLVTVFTGVGERSTCWWLPVDAALLDVSLARIHVRFVSFFGTRSLLRVVMANASYNSCNHCRVSPSHT